MKLCKIEGCEKAAKGRGWCYMHYARFRKTGDPLVTSREVNNNVPPHCTFGQCKKKHYAKGFCSAHYTRLWRHGSPGKTTRTPPGKVLEWMRAHLDCEGEDCLLWPFATGGGGYGVVAYKGRQRPAPNVMLRLAEGKPPTRNHECAHSCGNGHLGCVNPKHLRWATRKENHADKIKHGTSNRGEKSPASKLTEEQAREILSLKGILPGNQIASSYGVSPGAIYQIWRGKNWAWL